MRPFHLLIIIHVLIRCTPEKPVYDAASLKAFVRGTKEELPERSRQRLDSIIDGAQADSAVFRQTVEYLKSGLAGPGSAYRNDSLAIVLYQAIRNSKHYVQAERDAAAKSVTLVRQNQVGRKANDFDYMLPSGERHQLYDITTPYTLLFFYNPDCPACKEFTQILRYDPVVNIKLDSHELTVLAVYTEIVLDPWLTSVSGYPANWIVAHDDEGILYREGIYDLRAIPTVYLFDRNKEVLLKDCQDIQLIQRTLLNLE